MKVFTVCLIIAISGSVKTETPENGKYDEASKDHSVFDKILSINQKAARSRSGGKQPKLFEGDIVETPLVKQMIAGSLGRGAATSNERHLWPKNKDGYYEIPYEINSALFYYTSTIERAMREWMEKVPCLKFIPRRYQRGYIHYHSGSGCSSAVGHQGRLQYVSLGRGCLHHGIIVHEIGHALGFWHEQSRRDRNQYIRINTENIIPNMLYNFNIMYGTKGDGAYDYGSIMHYGPKAFSVNGRDTITPLRAGITIGQRQYLSALDVQQAKNLYKGTCKSITGGGTTGGGTTGGGTTGGGTTGGGTTGGGTTGGGTTGGGTTGGGTTGGCSDNHVHCKYWSNRGECTRNPNYMMSNCKKACCRNSNTNCEYWARRGECEKNPKYMVPYCRASCKKCGCKL